MDTGFQVAVAFSRLEASGNDFRVRNHQTVSDPAARDRKQSLIRDWCTQCNFLPLAVATWLLGLTCSAFKEKTQRIEDVSKFCWLPSKLKAGPSCMRDGWYGNETRWFLVFGFFSSATPVRWSESKQTNLGKRKRVTR